MKTRTLFLVMLVAVLISSLSLNARACDKNGKSTVKNGSSCCQKNGTASNMSSAKSGANVMTVGDMKDCPYMSGKCAKGTCTMHGKMTKLSNKSKSTQVVKTASKIKTSPTTSSTGTN